MVRTTGTHHWNCRCCLCSCWPPLRALARVGAFIIILYDLDWPSAITALELGPRRGTTQLGAHVGSMDETLATCDSDSSDYLRANHVVPVQTRRYCAQCKRAMGPCGHEVGVSTRREGRPNNSSPGSPGQQQEKQPSPEGMPLGQDVGEEDVAGKMPKANRMPERASHEGRLIAEGSQQRNTQIPHLSGCQAWQHRTQGFITTQTPLKEKPPAVRAPRRRATDKLLRIDPRESTRMSTSIIY